MSNDAGLDEGAQVFAEEARELLEASEITLLKLEDAPTDVELIDELFRNVHTIKGSAGLFGYTKVVAFTHVAESVLDRVRDGEVPLDNMLISTLLGTRDQMEVLVEHAINQKELAPEDVSEGQRLVALLDQYLEIPGGDQLIETEKEVNDPENGLVVDGPLAGNKNWHISLRFEKGVLRDGMDPQSFFRYLSSLGDVVDIHTLEDELPAFAEMDCLDCYLGFEIALQSEASKSEIEDVFEFVQDECSIHILPPKAALSEYMALIDQLPESNLMLGEILVKSGALTEKELEQALLLQDAVRQASNSADLTSVAPIGEVIVEQGMVDKSTVEVALEKQTSDRQATQSTFQSIRVDAEKLSSLINVVGELAISSAHAELKSRSSGDDSLVEAIEVMSRLVDEVRDSTMSLRMVQIGDTFNRYKRVVRDLGNKTGKDVDLVISGGETELDKVVVEKLGDPLMHLIRNAADHGVESPEERTVAGKTGKACIMLSAYHDSGSIIIEIEDNGRGLNKEKILEKAIEKNLISSEKGLPDNEIYRLIFAPGFSTADAVTDISGRGVGMDVVKRNIDSLRGQIDVLSQPGAGTKFVIRLPLTLAIIDGFQVLVGDSSYVIPLDMVDECIELDNESANRKDGGDYVDLRGSVLPYIRLGQQFHERDRRTEPGHRDNIVVVKYAGKKAGLVVDDLLGEHQTVIKPLGPVFENLAGFSGATILGSGEVAMIIDVASLVGDVARLDKGRVNKAANNVH